MVHFKQCKICGICYTTAAKNGKVCETCTKEIRVLAINKIKQNDGCYYVE